MKKILFSAAMLASAFAAAQSTGIGTTKPDGSAKLDVSSANQGVLLPRLALSSTTVAAPVTAPANGLTVFNTATAGDVTPGYYFWDGSKWVKILDSKATLPVKNIYTDDGALAANRTVNMGANSIAFTGTGNFGIAATDLRNNKLTVNGLGAARDQSTLKLTTPGAALSEKSGIGFYSTFGGGTSDTGPRRSADIISGYNAATWGSEYLSFNVGSATDANNLTSEKVRIQSDGKVGIGTNNPLAKLDVAGNIKIADGSQGANKVLTSDATGMASWKDLPTANIYTTDGALLGTRTVSMANFPLNFATGTGTFNINRGGSTSFGTDYTLGLSENSEATGKAAKIQFHNSNRAEGYLALATSGNRRFIMNDDQNVGMGLEVHGQVQSTTINANAGAATDNVVVADGSGTLKTVARSTFGIPLTNSVTNTINGTTVERAALTGDVTAAQNSNATTIAANAVTSAKIADGTIAAADLSAMGATAAGQNLTWNGSAWTPTTPAAIPSEPLQVMGGTTKATSNTENVYQMGKFATGTNNIIESSAQMEVKANSYFPLIVNSTVTTTDGSPGAGGVALVPNSDMGKRIELSTTQTGNFRIYMNGLGDVVNINKVNATLGRSFLNTDITVVKGAGNEQAYIGGDGSTNDVQIGSTNTNVTEITAWNWSSSKPMNFSGGNLTAQGTLRSTALTGAGDRPLVAMPDGTIKIGGVDNTANIYTSDGTIQGDRLVNINGKRLLFQNGEITNAYANAFRLAPAGNNAYGMIIRNDGSSFYILPTNQNDRFGNWNATRPFSYDFNGKAVGMQYGTGDGGVGIGTNVPESKLDVRGETRTNYLSVRPQDGTSEGGEINLNGTGGKAGSIIDNNSGMTRFFGQDKVQVLSPLQVTNIPTGPAGANILVNSGDGTIGQISAASLASSTEPWQVAGTTNKATDNSQNIYQMGTVGLGTNNPQLQLHVQSANEHKLRLQQTGQAAWTDIIKRANGIFGVYNNDGTNWLGGFFLNGGNLGIGTENPIDRLHVEGGIYAHNPGNSTIVAMSADAGKWAHNAYRVNNSPRWDAGMTGDGGQNYFINSFKDDGTYSGTPFFISRASNKVGIWNTNPQAQLQVGGGIRAQKGAPSNDSGNAGYSFENDGDTGLFAEGGGSAGSSDLVLRNDNGQAITIKGTGNVGIGTSNPLAKLDVAGNVKIADGSQGNGKILVSDANGLASWQPLSGLGNATANIYTQNGTIQDDRLVNVNGKRLLFQNGEITNEYANAFRLAPAGNNAYGMILRNDGSTFYMLPTAKNDRFGSWSDARPFAYNQDTRNLALNGDPNDGSVGIGTNAPQSKLEVRANSYFPLVVNSTNASGGGIAIIPNDLNLRTELSVTKDGTFRLWANGDRLYIDRNTGKTTVTADFAANGTTFLGSVPGGNSATDPILVRGASDGIIKAIPASAISTNIYNNNGTLTDNRTVDQAGKMLNFNNGGVTITGNSGVYFPLIINTMSGGNGGISVQPNGDASKRIELNTTPEGNFRLWGDGDKLNITRSNGNIGMGTGNPQVRLHLFSGNDHKLRLQHDGQNGYTDIAKRPNGTFAIFNNDGANWSGSLAMTQAGSVGVGTETPAAKLEVTGTGIYRDRLMVSRDGINAFGEDFTLGISENTQGTGKSAKIEFHNGGVSEGYIALANGGDRRFVLNDNQGVGMNLEVNGYVRTNAVIYNSDARLKTDVANLANATATVNGLRSVTYHWNEAGKAKGGDDALQYGFIAQEVEKVLPSLVATDDKGFKSVNYVAVVPVLVKALQEKDAEVKSLKSEVDQMKADLEAIKKSLNK